MAARWLALVSLAELRTASASCPGLRDGGGSVSSGVSMGSVEGKKWIWKEGMMVAPPSPAASRPPPSASQPTRRRPSARHRQFRRHQKLDAARRGVGGVEAARMVGLRRRREIDGHREAGEAMRPAARPAAPSAAPRAAPARDGATAAIASRNTGSRLSPDLAAARQEAEQLRPGRCRARSAAPPVMRAARSTAGWPTVAAGWFRRRAAERRRQSTVEEVLHSRRGWGREAQTCGETYLTIFSAGSRLDAPGDAVIEIAACR